MDTQIVETELQLMAGAIALGAVCAIAATLVLFPIIDRFVRPRFQLERGSAMILLLAVSLLAGIAGGAAGYFLLSDREVERREDPSGTQVEGPAPKQNSGTSLGGR